ncbi:MAG: hypothetical protein WA021_02625 [Minisyncoccia bacterium]
MVERVASGTDKTDKVFEAYERLWTAKQGGIGKVELETMYAEERSQLSPEDQAIFDNNALLKMVREGLTDHSVFSSRDDDEGETRVSKLPSMPRSPAELLSVQEKLRSDLVAAKEKNPALDTSEFENQIGSLKEGERWKWLESRIRLAQDNPAATTAASDDVPDATSSVSDDEKRAWERKRAEWNTDVTKLERYFKSLPDDADRVKYLEDVNALRGEIVKLNETNADRLDVERAVRAEEKRLQGIVAELKKNPPTTATVPTGGEASTTRLDAKKPLPGLTEAEDARLKELFRKPKTELTDPEIEEQETLARKAGIINGGETTTAKPAAAGGGADAAAAGGGTTDAAPSGGVEKLSDAEIKAEQDRLDILVHKRDFRGKGKGAKKAMRDRIEGTNTKEEFEKIQTELELLPLEPAPGTAGKREEPKGEFIDRMITEEDVGPDRIRKVVELRQVKSGRGSRVKEYEISRERIGPADVAPTTGPRPRAIPPGGLEGPEIFIPKPRGPEDAGVVYSLGAGITSGEGADRKHSLPYKVGGSEEVVHVVVNADEADAFIAAEVAAGRDEAAARSEFIRQRLGLPVPPNAVQVREAEIRERIGQIPMEIVGKNVVQLESPRGSGILHRYYEVKYLWGEEKDELADTIPAEEYEEMLREHGEAGLDAALVRRIREEQMQAQLNVPFDEDAQAADARAEVERQLQQAREEMNADVQRRDSNPFDLRPGRDEVWSTDEQALPRRGGLRGMWDRWRARSETRERPRSRVEALLRGAADRVRARHSEAERLGFRERLQRWENHLGAMGRAALVGAASALIVGSTLASFGLTAFPTAAMLLIAASSGVASTGMQRYLEHMEPDLKFKKFWSIGAGLLVGAAGGTGYALYNNWDDVMRVLDNIMGGTGAPPDSVPVPETPAPSPDSTPPAPSEPSADTWGARSSAEYTVTAGDAVARQGLDGFLKTQVLTGEAFSHFTSGMREQFIDAVRRTLVENPSFANEFMNGADAVIRRGDLVFRAGDIINPDLFRNPEFLDKLYDTIATHERRHLLRGLGGQAALGRFIEDLPGMFRR